MSRPQYISDIRFYSTTQANGRGPVAKGSLAVADALFINFAVWENNGTMQVQFPRTENPKFDATKPVGDGNKKFFDEVGPKSAEARVELVGYILEALEKERDGADGGISVTFPPATATGTKGAKTSLFGKR